MNNTRQRRSAGNRSIRLHASARNASNGGAPRFPWRHCCHFQLGGTLLRAGFVLGVILFLASCPMTPEPKPDTPLPAPTAKAGNDQTVAPRADVTLNGSESIDANGEAVASYQWQLLGSTPAGATVVLSNERTSGATFTAPSVGTTTTLEFRLTVTGSNGETASDTVNIIVSLAAPSASAGNDQPDIVELDPVTLNAGASSAAPTTSIQSYFWEQLSGPPVDLNNASTDMASFRAPFVPEARELEFRLTIVSNENVISTDRTVVTVSPSDKVDVDGDGLIEIDTLEMLAYVRRNRNGTSYIPPNGITTGCPDDLCKGYELTHDLDFDIDEDGSSWTDNKDGTFTLDSGDNNDAYFNVSEGGWQPISELNTIFDGNGHSISNLAIMRSTDNLGLFGVSGPDAIIRNIRLINTLVYNNNSNATTQNIGGLLGEQAGGIIIASSTSGTVYLKNGAVNSIGGLVGIQTFSSKIIASYSSAHVHVGAGNSNNVGALVGSQGDADPDADKNRIIASYATGHAYGGGGTGNNVGALIGLQDDGRSVITPRGIIFASYATGTAHGENGASANVGKLVGKQSVHTDPGGTSFPRGIVASSYGFGSTTGTGTGRTDNSDSIGALPEGVSTAAALTAANAGADADGNHIWNYSGNETFGAWDFGTGSQNPAVKYSDYDSVHASEYSCSMFPENLCGTIIPGQRE